MSRSALVVGINTYQYLPSLQAPAQDAEAIAQTLQTCGEFRVQRLPEVVQSGQPRIGKKNLVTLRDLETALINLFKPRGSNVPQTALFYFSGHGIQRDAGINEGYLAVGDCQPEVGFYGLSLFWLRRLLQESPVRQRIVILDCCHSGELLNFVEADPGARSGTDRLFIAASREFEAAYESLTSQYSVLTQALLEGLDPQNAAAGMVTSHSLTATVSQALKGELQQPLFENSGSEIILTRRSNATRADAAAARSNREEVCPYRGLEFFDEAHADFFFGREDVVEQLLDKLRVHSSATLVGASGSGKTSVLRAGVIPALRQGQRIEGSDRWRIKLMTPSEHPLRSLAAAFIDPELNDLARAEQLHRAEQFLQTGEGSLSRLVRATLAADPATTGTSRNRPRLLLIVDQLEEVFTLCTSDQERQQFFNCLTYALREADDCFSLLISLRSDFFHKCLNHRELAQLITQRMVMLKSLTYEQIKNTIVRPARKVGLVCEPNLVYTMLLDIIGSPGEMALLQYTLWELWQHRQIDVAGGPSRLTLNAYMELGGVRSTLQKRATETFYSLTPEEQIVARRIFLSLTQLGEGTEDTRRRVVKSELVTPAFSEDLVGRTVEKLVAAKLIVTNREAATLVPVCAGPVLEEDEPTIPLTLERGQETIDVTHEALIRNWTLLREWLEENREMLRRQRRIEQAAQEWDGAGQPSNGAYLLQELRLRDAEDFVKTYPQELSALAQQFVAVSQTEVRRRRRQAQQRRFVVPSALMITLAMTLSQQRSILQTAEKDHQLQLSTSREQAAIAQSILQQTSDATTALLISRLAAEQNGRTYEAQSSLRAALRDLRLHHQLQGHEGGVRRIVYSPKGDVIATAGTDGTIRLWARSSHAIYATQPPSPRHVLQWNEQNKPPTAIAEVRFSPNGQQIVAIAQNSRQVQAWDTVSGARLWQISLPEGVKHLAISADGRWVAVSGDRSLSVWSIQGQFQTTLLHPAPIRDLQFSPNGQSLLAAGEDGIVQIWQLGSTAEQPLVLQPTLTLAHFAAVQHVSVSPSGRWVGTVTADNKTYLWEAATGQLRQEFVPPQGQDVGVAATPTVGLSESSGQTPSMREVQFSPDETLLASIDNQQQVWLWNVQTHQLQARIQHNGFSVAQTEQKGTVVFSPNSQVLGMVQPGRQEAIATLWNPHTGQQLDRLGEGLPAAETIQFSPDGDQVATASADGTVRLWTTESGGELPTLTLPGEMVQWATFMPSNPALMAAPAPTAPAFPAPHAAWLQSFPSQQTGVPASANPMNVGSDLITVTSDGQLKRWQILSQVSAANPALQPEGLTHPLPVATPGHLQRFDPQQIWQGLRTWFPLEPERPSVALKGGIAQAVDAIANYTNWSKQAGQLPAQVMEPTGNTALTAFALSRDGQWAATTTAQGWVEIRQLQGGTANLHQRLQNLRSEVAGHTSHQTAPLRQLAFSPDNRLLLGVSDDFTVRLWDVQSGQLLKILRGHQAPVRQAQFSPDGQQIVTASLDKTAVVWDIATATPVLRLFHPERISSASFSPDGTRVATAAWDGTTRVFDLSTGEAAFVLQGHQGSVLDAQFSPDGRSLVTASVDGSARLWDARNGELQGELRPNLQHSVLMRRAFFSPDGQYVATLTDTGRVYLWAATWEALLTIARDRSLRQLTPEECDRYLRSRPNRCPPMELGIASQTPQRP